MRPYAEEVLRAIQGGIVAHLAPEVESTYGKAQFAFSMMLFTITLRDYDSAVPDLLEANGSLRGLLSQAGAALEAMDTDAARDARDGIEGVPAPTTSLRLSDLRADNVRLRETLATLAPLIEPAAEDPSLVALRGVRENVLAYLAADAKKRSVPILSS
jgi:hypothetical protein